MILAAVVDAIQSIILVLVNRVPWICTLTSVYISSLHSCIQIKDERQITKGPRKQKKSLEILLSSCLAINRNKMPYKFTQDIGTAPFLERYHCPSDFEHLNKIRKHLLQFQCRCLRTTNLVLPIAH